VQLRGLTGERCDADRVLEQSAGVGVMVVGRGRICAQVAGGEHRPNGRGEARMGDLRDEELDEAGELVAVPAQGRGQRRRVDIGRLERANVELEPVAEPLDAAEHTDCVAFREPAVEQLDVLPHARLDAPGRVDELEREVRRTRLRPQPSLRLHGVDGLDNPVLCELRNRHGRQSTVASRHGSRHLTDVSIIVQFLIVLVGLGVAIDYALLMVFRFRDELRDGNDVETALVETMTHAGHSVIVSGTTVAVGLLSMIVLPLPLLRGMGIGGMLIPVVSVLASLTLLPAMLAVLGTKVNRVRVLPQRLVDRGHPEDGAWGRWARFVLRRPAAVAAVGVLIVVVLAGLGTQLNPSEAQMKYFPGTGTAITGRDQLAAAGITPGVIKPLNVLVEHGGNAQQIAAKLRAVPGIAGASAPREWRRGQNSFVEAFASVDGAAPGIQGTIARVNASLQGTGGTLTGIAAVDRDFLRALFGSFPYALALVLLLTLILLTRAFRSIVLAVKAVLLNLLSLAAAFGIVVFIFQQGHGASLWNLPATQSITAYIPVMIFAFLFGLSMDYEVFMLSRMREAYDETGSTDKAIELGLARTGKLVTSAALILMFAFLVLSSSPGYEVKSLAIGLAAGIIFDATVIRALLVPALMKLLGDWNWWMPKWTGTVLRVPHPKQHQDMPKTPPVPVV
jgi:putative drug exporter of the RND superfamily